jgi:hypothetical protein
MVQIGSFEKFLKMVLGLPCLALEVTLGGHDVLLTGLVHFFVIAVIAGSDYDVSWAPLLLLLAALGALLRALGGSFGWCCKAAAGGHFHIT